jgi:hypothetical protein
MSEKKYYCPFCGEECKPYIDQPNTSNCHSKHVFPTDYAIPESESGKGQPITITVAAPKIKEQAVPFHKVALTTNAYLTNSTHGHVISNSEGTLARCGGPALCSGCKFEQSLLDFFGLTKQGIADNATESEFNTTKPNYRSLKPVNPNEISRQDPAR